jgi:hypothetical protein
MLALGNCGRGDALPLSVLSFFFFSNPREKRGVTLVTASPDLWFQPS